MPIRTYRYLRKHYLGETYVGASTEIDEVNEMVLKRFFGPELIDSLPLLAHDSRLANPEMVRSRIYILRGDEILHSMNLTYFYSKMDSIVAALNQEYIDSQLEEFQKIKLDDKNYNFILNRLIYHSDSLSIFFNNEYYLPQKMWSYHSGTETVKRFENKSVERYMALAEELGLDTRGVDYRKLKKYCKKVRTQVLELTDAQYDNTSNKIYGFGYFNFSYNEDKELIYHPIFLTMNLDFEIETILPFERSIGEDPETTIVATAQGLPFSEQFDIGDNEVSIKLYDGNFLPGYVEEGGNTDSTFYTSAIFQIDEKSGVNFSQYQKGASLLPQVIDSGQYYYNNYSDYLELNNSKYILYYSFPQYLQNTQTGEIITIDSHIDGKLFYSFTSGDRLFRVFKSESGFSLNVNKPLKSSVSQTYSLGDINNPSLYYSEGVLHIYSFLFGKNVEYRSIVFSATNH